MTLVVTEIKMSSSNRKIESGTIIDNNKILTLAIKNFLTFRIFALVINKREELIFTVHVLCAKHYLILSPVLILSSSEIDSIALIS